ncbi:30S ribosomal protein S18 [Streptomyces hyaluromycini]|uniref:30S ribosomal protein S18 n=1 Tax=Streptomyces hyaluromycini TaxID=1377993 RepID=A0ABV1WTX5_9ACTN
MHPGQTERTEVTARAAVHLVRKFLSDRGRIRSRRVTRGSARQQRLLARVIKNAREMALLPYGTAR